MYSTVCTLKTKQVADKKIVETLSCYTLYDYRRGEDIRSALNISYTIELTATTVMSPSCECLVTELKLELPLFSGFTVVLFS
jgi:hypothetical protein